MPNEYSQARRRVSRRSAELQLCALRATATARLDLRAQGGRGLPYPFSVAQIVNLLYRRLPIGSALVEIRRSGQGGLAALRRIAGCHPAELPPGRNVLSPPTLSRSAIGDTAQRGQAATKVAQTGSLLCRGLAIRRAPPTCQSAKQQIDNLRYEKSSRGATISADTDRLTICATLNGYGSPLPP